MPAQGIALGFVCQWFAPCMGAIEYAVSLSHAVSVHYSFNIYNRVSPCPDILDSFRVKPFGQTPMMFDTPPKIRNPHPRVYNQ